MMVSMGAASQATPVVTIVHDCQVLPAGPALCPRSGPRRVWPSWVGLGLLGGAAARP